MNKRKFLKNKITLYGLSDGKQFERTFTISRVIDAGADGICYEASHEKSSKGVLKEFYPLQLPGFERNEDGHLIYDPEFGGSRRIFLRTKEEFINQYEMLLDLRGKEGNNDFATFIPPFELYYGPMDLEHGDSTVYVWTPQPESVTFSKICDEIHKHPDVRPEYKLFIVLKAIETLTKCIYSLHMEGFVHRDIKPSNFGFLKRGNEMLTQSISLFDIDSITSVMNKSTMERGTEGYCEPDFGKKRFNNQTDIYSIGATLFTALIVTDEAKQAGYKFREEFWDDLGEMVRESELIKASERNSDSRLRNILTTILKGCLCGRNKRYERCEDLLEDIEKALFYTLPPEISKNNRTGERWVLAAAEKKLDANKEKNSSLVMMYHLYEHPLYTFAPDEEDELNIMITGLGFYGQKFLDMCLQTGQIAGKQMNVFVITENDTDREVYLEERPGLKDFFDISVPSREIFYQCPEPYGRIIFETVQRDRSDDEGFCDLLQKTLMKYGRKHRIHYIFTDLNYDKLNSRVSTAYSKVISDSGKPCHICYACEDSGETSKYKKSVRKNIYPVYMNSDVRKSELYPQIERMAFNVHLVWERNLNLDYNFIKKEFRKPYNHISCVTFVVSLKHKLHSIGIDPDEVSFEEAAQSFSALITSEDASIVRNGLIWTEHRRWVAEKICSGWSRLTDPERILAGVTKDERAKKHVCIVRSRPFLTLSEDSWQKKDKQKWDKASDKELNKLDDLDRLSVDMHRLYVKRAKEIRRRGLNTVGSLTELKYLVQSASGQQDAGIRSVFEEWYACIRNIWEGDRSGIRRYKSLRLALESSAEKLDEKTCAAIKEEIKEFDAYFHPVLAGNEYFDWKKNDIELIDNIPFILTYSEKIYLVIPFHAGKTADELFTNVAAATLVNPEKILYLYEAGDAKDLDALAEAFPKVTAYLRGKNLKASTEFIVIHDGQTLTEKAIEEAVTNAGGVLRKTLDTRAVEDQDREEVLKKYLKETCRGKSVFTGDGSDALTFINKSPFITAADMAALAGTSAECTEKPEFEEEHEELWSKYCEDPREWKRFCTTLGKLAAENDTLAVFDTKDASPKKEPDEYRYILPGFCITGAMKVIDGLKECCLIGQNSFITGYSSDSYEVKIYDRYGLKEQYDKLFSNIFALISPDAIKMVAGDKTTVVCDYLTIDEIDRAELDGPLTDYFRAKGFIITDDEGDGTCRLIFGSTQIKMLLTDARRIIGLQVYHEAKSLGLFDDVVSRRPSEDEDHYVVIMTHGLNSYFVSCCDAAGEKAAKAQLCRIAERSGVNATVKVLRRNNIRKQLEALL